MKRNKYQPTRLMAIRGKIYQSVEVKGANKQSGRDSRITDAGASPAPNHRCSKYHALPLVSKIFFP